MEEELQIVQTQLTASVKMQLDSASSALRTLETAQDQLHEIKTSLQGTVELARRSAALFDDPITSMTTNDHQSDTSTSSVPNAVKRYHNQYALIRAVSTAHANFVKARAIYCQLAGLERDVDRAIGLLRSDYEGNVLLIAGIVAKLDEFRVETLRMLAPPASPTNSTTTATTTATATTTTTTDMPSASGQAAVIFTLKRYFKRIDDVKQEFEARFWEEPRRVFAMLLNKQYSKIVKMAKVMARMAPEARARMTGIFEDLVQSKFAGVKPMIVVAGREGKLADALKLLQFYESDLSMIKDGLTNRFPADMNIVTFFMLSYHRNIANCIGTVLTECSPDHHGLSSGDTLELLSWTAEYHRSMEDLFGVPKEDLEPQLLEHRQEQLMLDRFVSESAGKVAEWIGTLVRTECLSLQQRTAPPDLDADDRYYTVAIIDLCRIVKQTVETAMSADLPALLVQVVAETVRSIQRVYLASLVRAIKQEWSKQRDPNQVVKSPYLEEWLIAIANNSMRWLTFTADFQESLSDTWSSDGGVVAVEKSFKQSNDAFLQLARDCCDLLSESVMTTLRPAWSQLFTAAYFNKPGATIGTVEATLADYFADWKARMDPFLFNRLVGDLYERSLAAVFEAMRSRPLKPDYHDALQEDISRLHAFFCRHRDPDKLTRPHDLAGRLLKLAFATTPRLFSLDAVPIVKQAAEALPVLEQCLLKRQDITAADREAFVEAVEGVRRRAREEQPEAPSVSFLRFVNARPATAASTAKRSGSRAKK